MSSSSVEDVGYEIKKKCLIITYGSGAVWAYSPVELSEFYRLYKSKQLSLDVHEFIRHSNIVGVKK